MKTVRQIVSAFGGAPAVAKFFGVPRQTVHSWVRRNTFAPELDVKLIEEAQRRGIDLEYADMARIRHVNTISKSDA